MLHRCTKCGELKAATEFYADKRWRGKRLSAACKQCVKDRARQRYDAMTPEERREVAKRAADWAEKNPGRRLEIAKGWRHRTLPARRKATAKRRDNAKAKAKLAAASRAYYTAHPERAAAQRRVRDAIRRGDLIRPTRCPRCGRRNSVSRIEAHHADYSKPLEVTWLCALCHRDTHYYPTADQP